MKSNNITVVEIYKDLKGALQTALDSDPYYFDVVIEREIIKLIEKIKNNLSDEEIKILKAEKYL